MGANAPPLWTPDQPMYEGRRGTARGILTSGLHAQGVPEACALGPSLVLYRVNDAEDDARPNVAQLCICVFGTWLTA